jgi:hypothetical protein
MSRTLLASLILLALAAAAQTKNGDYEVVGTLVVVGGPHTSQSGVPTAVITNRFEIFSRQEQWRINLYDASNTAAPVAVTGSATGTEVVDETPAGPPLVWVASQPFPNGVTAHLWFMYLSTSFLAGTTNNRLLPVYKFAEIEHGDYGGEQHNPRAYKEQPVVMTLSDGPPKLPRRAAFFNDGWSGQSVIAWHANPPPFQNGYTNAIYEAEDFQKVGNVTLPRRARFTLFAPEYDGRGSNSLRVVRTAEARVDVIRSGCSAQAVAIDLPERYFCLDSRLQNGTNGARKDYTQKQFASIPTIKQLEGLAKATPRTPAPPKHSRGIVLTALLVATVSVPVALVVSWLRQKGNSRAKKP